MRTTYKKYWFIYSLIIGIYALSAHSYGDVKSLSDDNDANESRKVTFENLIKNMNGRRRVRRALGDSTMISDTSTITTQSWTSATSNTIYVITAYTDPGNTIQTITYATQTSQIPSVTSNSVPNGTYIITRYDPITTAGTTQSTTRTSSTSSLTFTTTTPPNICNNGTHTALPNGTCDSRESQIQSAINTLKNSSANDTEKANALTTYITAVTNSSISSNSSNTLTIGEIDKILGNLTNANYNVSTNDSIIVITQPNCTAVTNVIGASFETTNGPTVVDTRNRDNVTDSSLRAAGIVNFTARCDVTTFNMLIINNPTTYQNIDNSTNRTLVSSIVVAKIGKQSDGPLNIVINLYFQDLTRPTTSEGEKYLCAFYNTNTSQWDESGCDEPTFNRKFQRYECKCHHLSSFALIWLPKPPQPPDGKRVELDAQDKASIAFQLLSIICFLGIIIHAITVRILYPQRYTQSRHLLPVVSYGIIMILFIFYIALGLTVYSRYAQSNTNIKTSIQQRKISEEQFNGKNLPTELNPRADASSTNSSSSHVPCLPVEHALMFIVYFFIIFMFCSKTTIGIDNYRRYVQLFPPPSPRMLVIMLASSLLISGIWVAFAAGLNSNPSIEISGIYLDKICWFNRSVIHYFLTIPICIFLTINIIMFIPVVKHNITHAKITEEDRSYYTRRKRCVYILLASCVTQGFGWLFGPLMLVASPVADEVLAWFFIIFNGLEGVWVILLYILFEKEGINDNQRDRDSIRRHSTHNEIDTPEIQLDDIGLDRQPDPLAILRSDSPRNSFTNFSASEAHHRRYQANNNDRL